MTRSRLLAPFGLAVALALASATLAGAASPLPAELDRVARRYHQDLASLDRVRDALEREAATNREVEVLVALSRAWFLWGEVRAQTPDEKLEAYDRGREIGRRAVELAPRSAAAHFWYAANTGRWGQTRGVVRSLFLLPEVQREIQTVIELDPSFTPVYALAGNVYYEVPGLLGGDLEKAEAMFRKGLEQDPRYTSMRVGLARVLIRRGRRAEARRELQAVLAERSPSNPADYAVKDAAEARRLLDSIAGE